MRTPLFFLLIFSFVFTGLQAQTDFNAFFNKTDKFLKSRVQNNGVVYKGLKSDAQLAGLIAEVAAADLSAADAATRKAFLINAYNLLVINGAAQAYPLSSVQNISGFFDGQKHNVAGKKVTLNQLEKAQLLRVYEDARLHFVLVCGAEGCPPITNFAYRPGSLDRQLDAQTRKAVNDSEFIRVDKGAKTAQISKIFEWYAGDFGGNKNATLAWINKYRADAIPTSYKISYYNYDWNLNEVSGTASVGTPQTGTTSTATNDNRYVVSSTLPVGTTETKLFNNLYSEQSGQDDVLNSRATFFTSQLSFLYGVNERFNAGFDLRYRRVNFGAADSSPLAALSGSAEGQNRARFTTFGPKIRWAPVKKWENFSVQSALWFGLADDLAGNFDAGQPFIDWNGPTFFTQIFNDFTLGDRFSLFAELDVFIEDIGGAEENFNKFTLPTTVIFSYFPVRNLTLYGLLNYAPTVSPGYDYWTQQGVGAKYQFTPNFEIELLFTNFDTQKFNEGNAVGNAATWNIGFRYNGI